MSERLFNIGYVGFAKEATPGIALTPTDYGQAYDFNVRTQRNFDKIEPAAGNVYSIQNVVAGLRDHMGDATLVFEPNTAEKLAAMMLAQTSRTGGGPYTGVYGLSSNNPPGATYTIEVSDGVSAQRYFGCQVEKLAPEMSNNEIKIKPTISAVGSFNVRNVASVAGVGPYVLTLDTTYDLAPTTGLVVGDIMQWITVAGVATSFTVSALSSTTVSTTTNVSAAVNGDTIRLRALTPAFNMLPPVLWSNTVFGFGATAAAALTNATVANQTRVDQGSTWELSFPFKDNKGEHRSGGQDPATLLRKPADATLTVKKFFDGPNDLRDFNMINKTACVIRHFVYSGANTYEFRITFNHLVTDSPLPQYKASEINYSELKYINQYDTADSQATAVTVVNANATLT